jgi:hypothetical protein
MMRSRERQRTVSDVASDVVESLRDSKQKSQSIPGIGTAPSPGARVKKFVRQAFYLSNFKKAQARSDSATIPAHLKEFAAARIFSLPE